MTKRWTISRWMVLSVLGIAGCEQRYYVADVHHAGGALVMTKCELDYRGMATHHCHEEILETAPPRVASPAEPSGLAARN